MKDASSGPFCERFTGSWLYLRLFYTATSLIREKEDILYAYMLVVFTRATVSTYFALSTLRPQSLALRSHLNAVAISVFYFITVPLFTELLSMMGKWTWLHPQRPIKPNKHSCCIQALVFPTSVKDAVCLARLDLRPLASNFSAHLIFPASRARRWNAQ